MTKTIAGVPEALSREQYLSLFRAVGIAPEDTLSLRFLCDGVEAVVFERDEQGCKVFAVDQENPDGGSYAKHTVYIPVR